MPHISLAAEKLWQFGPLPITNSLLATWSVMAILFVLSFFATRNMKFVPGALQSIMEMIIDGLHSFFSSILGHHTKKVFPLISTIFLFVIVANWEGLLPGFGTIGLFHEVKKETITASQQTDTVPIVLDKDNVSVHEEVSESVSAKSANHIEEKEFTPLFRGATADLNTTIALALVAFLAIQYYGFSILGIKYSKKFINFSNPISFFIGILEIISDLSKIISFAFRLFGNIFAGEVLLVVIAFLIPFLAPMPFLMLELFVGFIQALVFSTLTAVFINVSVSHEE